jgi:hypothetical protein
MVMVSQYGQTGKVGAAMPIASYGGKCGHLVPAAAVQLAAAFFGRPPAPLFEEERHVGVDTVVADTGDPRDLERPVARPGLAAGDDPADPVQVEIIQRS